MFCVNMQMSSKRSSDRAGIFGLLSVVAFIACMFFSVSAFAQSSGSTGVSISAAASEFVSQVTTALNQLESTIQSNLCSLSGTLSADGTELEWALFSVMFVWTAITGMLKGESLGEVFAQIITQILMLGIVMACLNSSSQNALTQTFSTISSQFGAGTNLSGGFKSFFTAISSLWSSADASSTSSGSSGSNWFSSLFHTIGDFDLGSILAGLAIVILKLATTVIMAGAAALWAGNYILSQMKVYIGLAVAPVMVPWLLMPYTTFLFDGWLKYMIGAGMMQIVGAIMIKMTDVLMTTMTTVAQGATATNVILYVVLIVLALVIAYMMSEINGIAMGLLGGGSRVGMGFGAWSSVKNWGPHRGLGATAQRSAQLAGKGARVAGQGLKSAGQAALSRIRGGGGGARGGGASGGSRKTMAAGGGVRATMAQARGGSASRR
ncbi:type IV secretion system protein [Paraburkholderia aromaticivorans]|nr:type IV secretion system protein [Paraburkholderia aromaticivorans]